MSQARKQLKIVSFVQVACMLLAVVTGIVCVVSVPGPQTSILGMEPVTSIMLLGVLCIAAGIAAFLAAARGIKGANVPSRLGPHAQICAVSLLFSAVAVVLAGVGGEAIAVVPCLVLVADVVAITRGSAVRKELDR